MTVSRTFLERLIINLERLRERVSDLETSLPSQLNIITANTFPINPTDNMLVIRTDLTPPDGGQMYRYNLASGEWLRMN